MTDGVAAPPSNGQASLSPEPRSSSRKTVLESVLSAQSYYILLFGLIPGFTLIFSSILLGIYFFKATAPEFAPIDREVGYLPALNWSLTYAVLLPAALYLMTESIQGIADALDNLHARRMVRDRNLKVIDDRVLPRSWEIGTRTRSWLLLVFGIVIPALYAF